MGKPKNSFRQIWGSLRVHLRLEGYQYVFDTLVVILGILIAFSLDSWYENSTRKTITRAYASSLISDLQDDIENVSIIQAEMQEYILRIDSLAAYVRNREPEALSNLDLFPLLTGGNRPYSWNRVTMDDLKQSGILRDAGNEKLSRLIAKYEALTIHMEEDYNVDLTARERVSAMADEIVDLNYSNFKDLAPRYWNPNNYHVLTDDFSNTAYYATAREDQLRLLTTDKTKIREMINGYLRLRFFLNIRAHSELPGLIARAEEIIEFLKSEYLE